MILLSQAYVLRKIWGIKTDNKSYLTSLSKSWTFQLFIKNNFKILLKEQGIISYFELSNFREKNWKEWINNFNRYNLSPKVWYSISPNKWRFKVSEHWKKNKIFNIAENTNLNILKQTENSSIFIINDSVEKSKKSNKLLRKNLLTYKILDPNKNSIIKNFSKLNEKSIYNDLISNRIHKYPVTLKENIVSSNFLINKKNIFFEYNLLLWFVPEFLGQGNRNKSNKILDLDTSIIKHRNLEIFRNKELLRERELNRSIRQWRWKSKNYEKKFKKLGNMASLMTFMQNQETMISLSGKMKKDLDLFRLFFRRNNNFNRLTINSEHRLPRLLDDQTLIYKLISTSLNFKQRLKKITNLEKINEYYNNKNNSFSVNSLNIEDILLPKRRREFRILNCLTFHHKRNIKSNENLLKNIREQNQRVEKNKNQIIKRFIWSSYRFEDLACMNRFWFSTMNGSRFSMLRFRLYPII